MPKTRDMGDIVQKRNFRLISLLIYIPHPLFQVAVGYEQKNCTCDLQKNIILVITCELFYFTQRPASFIIFLFANIKIKKRVILENLMEKSPYKPIGKV